MSFIIEMFPVKQKELNFMRMAFIVRAGGGTFERIMGNEVRRPVSVASSKYQVYEKYCLNITSQKGRKEQNE